MLSICVISCLVLMVDSGLFVVSWLCIVWFLISLNMVNSCLLGVLFWFSSVMMFGCCSVLYRFVLC